MLSTLAGADLKILMAIAENTKHRYGPKAKYAPLARLAGINRRDTTAAVKRLLDHQLILEHEGRWILAEIVRPLLKVSQNVAEWAEQKVALPKVSQNVALSQEATEKSEPKCSRMNRARYKVSQNVSLLLCQPAFPPSPLDNPPTPPPPPIEYTPPLDDDDSARRSKTGEEIETAPPEDTIGLQRVAWYWERLTDQPVDLGRLMHFGNRYTWAKVIAVMESLWEGDRQIDGLLPYLSKTLKNSREEERQKKDDAGPTLQDRIAKNRERNQRYAQS